MRNTIVPTRPWRARARRGARGSHSRRVFTNDRVMTNNGDPPGDRLDISAPRDAREKHRGMTDDRLKVARARERLGRCTQEQVAVPRDRAHRAPQWSWALVFPERGRAPSPFRCVSIVPLLPLPPRPRSGGEARQRKMLARPWWPRAPRFVLVLCAPPPPLFLALSLSFSLALTRL